MERSLRLLDKTPLTAPTIFRTLRSAHMPWSEAGLKSRQIMSVTGHKCKTSYWAPPSPDKNYVFYIHGAEDQVCSGFLYKSPPENQFKTQKSWKRRFCVLLKYNNNKCLLKYYKNEETNKSLGQIDLSKVTFMFLNPEMHAMWKWIHDNFRCSPSCVMFIRVPERDYFLIGENSWEMEKWFNALYAILNNRPHKLLDPKTFGSMRHISEPPQSENDNEQKAEWGQPKYIAHELPSPMTHEPIYVSPAKFKKLNSES